MAVIIRLQNLPWSANAADIRRFFAGRSIPEGGVHIVGGEDGDAFIAFSSDEDARLAMRLDGQQIKGIRVRLYLSSKAEMQNVITIARELAANKTPARPATTQFEAIPSAIAPLTRSEISPGSYQAPNSRESLPMDINPVQRAGIGSSYSSANQHQFREYAYPSATTNNTDHPTNDLMIEQRVQTLQYQRSHPGHQGDPSSHLQSTSQLATRDRQLGRLQAESNIESRYSQNLNPPNPPQRQTTRISQLSNPPLSPRSQHSSYYGDDVTAMDPYQSSRYMDHGYSSKPVPQRSEQFYQDMSPHDINYDKGRQYQQRYDPEPAGRQSISSRGPSDYPMTNRYDDLNYRAEPYYEEPSRERDLRPPYSDYRDQDMFSDRQGTTRTQSFQSRNSQEPFDRSQEYRYDRPVENVERARLHGDNDRLPLEENDRRQQPFEGRGRTDESWRPSENSVEIFDPRAFDSSQAPHAGSSNRRPNYDYSSQSAPYKQVSPYDSAYRDSGGRHPDEYDQERSHFRNLPSGWNRRDETHVDRGYSETLSANRPRPRTPPPQPPERQAFNRSTDAPNDRINQQTGSRHLQPDSTPQSQTQYVGKWPESSGVKPAEIDFSQLPPWLRDDASVTNQRRQDYKTESSGRNPFGDNLHYPDRMAESSQSMPPNGNVTSERQGNVRRPQPVNALLETPPAPRQDPKLPFSQRQTPAGNRRSLLQDPGDHDMRRLPTSSCDGSNSGKDEPDRKRGRFEEPPKRCLLESNEMRRNQNCRQSVNRFSSRPSIYIRLRNCDISWTPRVLFSILKNVSIAKPAGFRFEADKIGRRTGNVFAKLAGIDQFDAIMSYNGMPVYDNRLNLRVEACSIEEFYSVHEEMDPRPSSVKPLADPMYYRDMCLEIVGLPTFYKKPDLVKLFSDAHIDESDIQIEMDGENKCTGSAYIICRRREDFHMILSKNGRLVYQEPFRILAISYCQLCLLWNKYKGYEAMKADSYHRNQDRPNADGDRPCRDGSMDRSNARGRRDRDRRDYRDRDRDRRDIRDYDRRDRERDRFPTRNYDGDKSDSNRKDRDGYQSESKRMDSMGDYDASRKTSNSRSPAMHKDNEQDRKSVSSNLSDKIMTPDKSRRDGVQSNNSSPLFGCQLFNLPKNIDVSEIAGFLGRNKTDTDGIYIFQNEGYAVVTLPDEKSTKHIALKNGLKLNSNTIRVIPMTSSDLKSKLAEHKKSNFRSLKPHDTDKCENEGSVPKGMTSDHTHKGDSASEVSKGLPRLTIGNLPVNATVTKVEEFFMGFDFVPGSVSLRLSAQGKPLGEAVVAFRSAVDIDRVIREYQGRKMGGRPITLRYGTP